MLGRHTQCAWAELDRGSTQSIGVWTSFLPTPIDQRMVMVNNIRDGKTMYFAIQPHFLIFTSKLDFLHISGWVYLGYLMF